MKRTTILFAVMVGLIAVAGCTQPTVQPSVQPTIQPTVQPTGQPATPTVPTTHVPTTQPTPLPAIAPFPGDYRHSLYGYFAETGYVQTTRPAQWRGQPISAAGEVNVKTKANDTIYTGYMQADGSYLVDGIPTGNDVKVVNVKVYRNSGTDLLITVESEWLPFNEVAQRTQLDIG